MDDKVVSGQAWDEFCDTLKRAGQQVLRPEAPSSPLDRAEGYRYLTRLLRIGLEMHLEFADPAFPGFFSASHETGKIGADNPDNRYLNARVDGRYEYMIEGDRGGAAYFSIGSQKGGYETDGRMEQTGFLDGAEIQPSPDGRIRILLSQTKRSGNWLGMEAATNMVIVRQTFRDRANEKPAQLTIRRLDAGAKPEPLSTARLAAGLANSARFVEGTARVFADWAQSYLPHPNQLPSADQQLCQRAGGDPNIHYYHSYWELKPDEALVIHVPRIPECRFWNLQIDNWWMESLDYRYVRAHFNRYSAQRDRDGGVTMVLAHTDPGHPNWLETAGHDRGTMCFRWVGAKELVHPQTRVVPVSQVANGTGR